MSGRFVFGWKHVSTWSKKLLDQWYGPDQIFFKVRADDGHVYVLRHETALSDGGWELVS